MVKFVKKFDGARSLCADPRGTASNRTYIFAILGEKAALAWAALRTRTNSLGAASGHWRYQQPDNESGFAISQQRPRIRKGPEWPRTYKYNVSPNILAITTRTRASKELEACTTGSDGG